MSDRISFRKLDDYRWEIPQSGGMRVPGLVYADAAMIPSIESEKAAEQVANVAHLRVILGASMAMPDIHWGYGFPIGGVAAMDAKDGVISPGGVGFDICCGVRLLRSNLKREQVEPHLDALIPALFHAVPSGVGSEGRIRLDPKEMRKVLRDGALWAVRNGYGSREDLETTEDGGCHEQADPDLPSARAVERGKSQLGTLGSGNHFLEVQVVERIYDGDVAQAFGLFPGQVTVMIHTGSRGFGYQVCDDFLDLMQPCAQKYGITLPDRQLAAVPLASSEGRNYLGAMYAAANYARANRQAITHWTRETFQKVMALSPRELGMAVVYDVAHNLAKMEEHHWQGKTVKVCVHRKGATRAFPAGHPDVPEKYRAVGQPVFVPGTMGTASWVLVGTDGAMEQTWGSTCHGAGRTMSRAKAARSVRAGDLLDRMKKLGVRVQAKGMRTLVEETPEAYKDVDQVVEVCHQAGISRKVARLLPLGVVKG